LKIPAITNNFDTSAPLKIARKPSVRFAWFSSLLTGKLFFDSELKKNEWQMEVAAFCIDPRDSFAHAHGFQLQFGGNIHINSYVACFNQTFLENVNVDEPRNWTYSMPDNPPIQLRCRKIKPIQRIHLPSIISRLLGQMFLESFNPSDVINVTYVGETINFSRECYISIH
jgi:hypothetical protein